MKTTVTRFLTGSLLALSMTGAYAADAVPSPGDKLAAAREQIAANQWASAIAELKRVNDSGSADWNNLMGFSLRKAETPDLAASEAFYNAALRIDPRHRGTLEYSGELYLMKGDLPMAEQRLAALDKICMLPCTEYTALKRSIERFKAAGGKPGSYEY